MSKIIQNLFAFCYTLLVIIGLGDLFIHHLTGMLKIVFLSLLVIFTIAMMFVLREEENEELKGN